jgi:hypothetical protein
VDRLLRLVSGEPAATVSGTEGFEQFSERVQPHSPGLRARMWYGAASLSSARWAGEHRMHLLTSSVVQAEESTDFSEIQSSQIRAFRAAYPDGGGRVSQGLVVIPTDSATREQKDKYASYVAQRTPRTLEPQGPRRMMFSRDYLGTSDEIATSLYSDAGFREVTEVAFALPFSFQPRTMSRYSPIWHSISGRRSAGGRRVGTRRRLSWRRLNDGQDFPGQCKGFGQQAGPGDKEFGAPLQHDDSAGLRFRSTQDHRIGLRADPVLSHRVLLTTLKLGALGGKQLSRSTDPDAHQHEHPIGGVEVTAYRY